MQMIAVADGVPGAPAHAFRNFGRKGCFQPLVDASRRHIFRGKSHTQVSYDVLTAWPQGADRAERVRELARRPAWDRPRQRFDFLACAAFLVFCGIEVI